MEKMRAKKSLGQNFLIDDSVLSRIVACVAPVPGDAILEVGPGRGALTKRLAASGAQFLAIEWDRDLLPLLNAEFAGAAGVWNGARLSLLAGQTDWGRLAFDG